MKTLLAALFLVVAGLVAYSQTHAYAFDEGFHLVAAQLIMSGKRPYLDFFFPQTPLNAYWNALWMTLLGQVWRIPHLIAALESSAAVVLTVDYVYRRLPELRWRTLGALFAACSMGFNILVIQFGTLGQAYGLCLLLIVVAFRAAVAAVDRRGPWLAGLAGLLSSAAACSSLLTAPIAPMLLIWILIVERSRRRLLKLAAFLGGVLVGAAPVLWLFIQSPGPVIFGILKFHLLYRKVEWAGWFSHDVGVALGLFNSPQALILILMGVFGLVLLRNSGWERRSKAELYLCAWLALAETLHLLTAHPTFSRYFLFPVPFLAILGSAGVCWCGERVSGVGRSYWAVGTACVLAFASLATTLFDARDDWSWRNVEEIASKIDSVTPPGAPIYADEDMYFFTKRLPLPGMNNADGGKLVWMRPSDAAALHIVPRPALDALVKSGAFSTVEACEDDEVERLGLAKIYANKAEPSGCAVFWGRK